MYSIDEKYDVEFLYDCKPDRTKENTWRLHRLITLRLAQAYKRNNSVKYKRIVECASLLEFRRYADDSLKLKYANFCQTRLCPTCNWRRSKKIFAQVSHIMGEIENNYTFIFLTLTCRNVEGHELSNQIDNIVLAYKKLCKYKRFQKAVRGWVRCFEVTHNWKSREYHPHYHVILAVDKNYFKSDLYIQQNDWCLLWQSCMGVDYKPIVDVRIFTDSEKGKGKKIAEVAKYTIKSSNIMANLQGVKSFNADVQNKVRHFTDSITDEIVYTLDSALAGRRLMGYGGIFKQKHKELNLKDDDLIHISGDDSLNIMQYDVERYYWDIRHKDYVKTDFFERGGADNEEVESDNADD
jgi:plasmid rolling circle replication initiator protein Rep